MKVRVAEKQREEVLGNRKTPAQSSVGAIDAAIHDDDESIEDVG
jgi:hypothetical protein